MIRDIRIRIINGEKILEKYAPSKISGSIEEPDAQGYITINMKDYTWQRVSTFDFNQFPVSID